MATVDRGPKSGPRARCNEGWVGKGSMSICSFAGSVVCSIVSCKLGWSQWALFVRGECREKTSEDVCTCKVQGVQAVKSVFDRPCIVRLETNLDCHPILVCMLFVHGVALAKTNKTRRVWHHGAAAKCLWFSSSSHEDILASRMSCDVIRVHVSAHIRGGRGR